jgi:hypothetical protein
VQPDLGATFFFLFFDCVAVALAMGGLVGLRQAARLWFGEDTFVISDRRPARRAKLAWRVFWLVLGVLAAGTLVTALALMFTGTTGA